MRNFQKQRSRVTREEEITERWNWSRRHWTIWPMIACTALASRHVLICRHVLSECSISMFWCSQCCTCNAQKNRISEQALALSSIHVQLDIGGAAERGESCDVDSFASDHIVSEQRLSRWVFIRLGCTNCHRATMQYNAMRLIHRQRSEDG